MYSRVVVTVLLRVKVQRAPPSKKLRIGSRGKKDTTAPQTKNDVPPMTMEEKRDLSIALADMGSDLLNGIVEIIKERHADLIANKEELEIDIDALDDATLWELKRFVEEKMEGPGPSGEVGSSAPPAQVSGSLQELAHNQHCARVLPATQRTPSCTARKQNTGFTIDTSPRR